MKKTNIKNIIKNSYNSLISWWNSSPKPHTFVSLPLKSSVFSRFKSKLTLKNILILISSIITGFFVRNSLIYMFDLKVNILWDCFLLGIPAHLFSMLIISIIQHYQEVSTLGINSESLNTNVLHMNDPASGGNAGGGGGGATQDAFINTWRDASEIREINATTNQPVSIASDISPIEKTRIRNMVRGLDANEKADLYARSNNAVSTCRKQRIILDRALAYYTKVPGQQPNQIFIAFWENKLRAEGYTDEHLNSDPFMTGVMRSRIIQHDVKLVREIYTRNTAR